MEELLYKPSCYNLIDNDYDGGLLIANLLNTTFLKVAPKHVEEIQNLLRQTNISKEYANKYSQLLEKGMIVPKERNEYEIADLKYYEIAYSKDMLDITIIPTDACNFNCSYCYQEKRHNQFIDEVNEEKILKFLERNVRYFKKVQIGWFGGEPLLMKDMMLSLIHI